LIYTGRPERFPAKRAAAFAGHSLARPQAIQIGFGRRRPVRRGKCDKMKNLERHPIEFERTVLVCGRPPRGDAGVSFGA